MLYVLLYDDVGFGHQSGYAIMIFKIYVPFLTIKRLPM